MTEPKLLPHRIEVVVTQDGNTLGTTSDVESLTIAVETQLPGEMPFFVIKTDGWSFNKLGELVPLLAPMQDLFKAFGGKWGRQS